ncbi:MAG: winged helix-turn-helix domain-containing protein [Bifidobacteriaceae bacterium]|jgi:DNA-binding response OmpR family regulator|nr:winged helix-turn-helix domain-containing protein [Bifidobacteriaceae bacterium]
MTATAYAPSLPTTQFPPYRRRPAYRGPLIAIPGGRARLRAAALDRSAVPPARIQEAGPAAEPTAAVRAFQARLRALPARSEIRLSRATRSAAVDGCARSLTPREFALLATLAEHPGQPVNRDRLAQDRSGHVLGEGSRAVDVHIAHLREKLNLPGAIATVRGRGYALNPAYRVSFSDQD